MNILGINAFHGDASACLVRDGKLVYAAAEERFNRKKHCAGFPTEAIRACLAHAGLRGDQIDHVAISRNPNANLHRKLLFTIKNRPSMGKILERLTNAKSVRGVGVQVADALGLAEGAVRARVHPVEHHRAHLASAFFPSGWDDAACLSIDGFGDFVSTMFGSARGNDIEVLGQVEFPHSLGNFYTAATQYIGYPRYGEEWKLMGLAPYGKPVYLPQMREIVYPTRDGGFETNLDYFMHHTTGTPMSWDDGSPVLGRIWSDKWEQVFGPTRREDEDFYGKWADIAHSAQAVFEEIFFHVLRSLHARTNQDRLVMAGGCALNSVANGKITEMTPFKEVYVQPAAGDDGTAIGAALYAYHCVLKQPRTPWRMDDAYTGTQFTRDEVMKAIETKRAGGTWDSAITVSELDEGALCDRTARAIGDGRIVGWYQGRMEFGPRALGNRSIVADPRRADMKDILNQRIKRRETYRPFAPSVLAERVGEYYEKSAESPFMLMVYKTREAQRTSIPAVNHVDDTGRVQTVTREANPRYHALISAFAAQTGVGLVLNTSFNENEPIVHTPQEALDCFLRTKMDVLALGDFLLERPAVAPGP